MSPKRKVLKTVVVSIVILSIIGISLCLYYNFQKDEKKRLEDAEKKTYFMLIMDSDYYSQYINSDYNEKYWKDFLGDENTIDCVRYLNQYMKETYPNSPYTEITTEDLNTDYRSIYKQWKEDLSTYLKEERKYEEDNKLSRIINKAVVGGWWRDIMSLLGYDERISAYNYNTAYTDEFLKQEDLESFLNELNQYMKENYPEIEFEDITMGRLQETEYDVCDQLWEVKEKLAEEGVDFAEIMREIHGTVVTADS